MRESVIASAAGLAVMSATAALAAALLTWEPSIVAPATASVAPAAPASAPVGVASPFTASPAIASFDLPAPDLPADIALSTEPVAELRVPEPVFAALTDPVGGPFTFRAVLPDALTTSFAEPSPAQSAGPSPALREMVRREVAGRDSTLVTRPVLPPPRPAFIEVRAPATATTDVPSAAPATQAWGDLSSPGIPSWPNLFSGLGESETRPVGPERTLQSGMASWYGPGFHGRRTASGEVFNQNALTAAHRHLPFGTKVRVVDQTTGRSIVVRINDRGPFSHGRVIDLSKASAQALGMGGTARVKIVSAE